MKKIIQNWMGPHLPLVHLRYKSGLKNLMLDLTYHPVKRRIAKYYVYFLQKYFGLTIIGITGSAGKTTTKEMLAGILKLSGNTVWSKDNIDPVYNIPSTILKCFIDTKYLVLEMGVEYPDEMDFYLWIVKPKIGVVTNIFPTHTEFFGDEKGVAKEKQKLVNSLPSNGFVVLNPKNIYTKNMARDIKAKVFYFDINVDPVITNSNTARKIAEILKIPDEIIIKGLNNYESPKHRLSWFKHKSGAVILDDTYNSNPEALLSTLRVFNKQAEKNIKIAVIGDMLELGKLEEKEHKKIGLAIKKYKFNKILGVGKAVKFITPDIYSNVEEAWPVLKKFLKPNTYILLKGSRSIGLDKIVDKLV